MRNSRSRALLLGGIALTTMLGLAACTGDDSSGSASPTGSAYAITTSTAQATGDVDDLTWAISGDPTTLDYKDAFDYATNTVLANVCESLLRQNADLSVSPGLATSWSSPDDLTIVYEIRPGVQFHDGSTMTAADVVASLERNRDATSPSVWFETYQNVASIEATGDLEVTVRFTSPDPVFNTAMSTAAGVVESASTLAASGEAYGTPATGVNCTGPFSLGAWVPGDSITLDRFDGYWDKDLRPFAATVTMAIITDPNTLVSALLSGEVDGTFPTSSGGYERLLDSSEGNLYFGEDTAVMFEVVSNLDGPLGDPVVRQALLMAIDRAGLVAGGEGGFASVQTAAAPAVVWSGVSDTAYDDVVAAIDPYDLDVEAAKKMVTDSGHAGESITVATASVGSNFEIIAEQVADAATAIGLDVTLKTLQPNEFFRLFADPAAREGIDLFFTKWGATTADPLSVFNAFVSDSTRNYGGWSSDDFDAAYKAALATVDPAERAAATVELEKIFNEELPWIPLYTPALSVWMNKSVTGVAPSPYYQWYPWAALVGAP